jgi:putative transcriptional regulator
VYKLTNEGFLNGQLLLAMPGITNPRFESTVIYVCTHTEEGAMGLVINKQCENINFPDLLTQLNIDQSKNNKNKVELSKILLHEGGPVESGRGFILHSADYVQESTLIISETMALTATIDILTSIAIGDGPQDYLIALGFSGWGRGQLENEIRNNSWLSIEADEELVFRTDIDLKMPRAMAKLGVDLSLLSSQYGRA